MLSTKNCMCGSLTYCSCTTALAAAVTYGTYLTQYTVYSTRQPDTLALSTTSEAR